MRLRDWFNAIRNRDAPVPGSHQASHQGSDADQQIRRWKKALSDFGYPYDLVSGSSADDALALAKLLGRENGFVPVVVVPGHWNSNKITSVERTRRAREMLQWTEFGAADGRQFLANTLLAMHDELEIDPDCPDPTEFDKLQPREGAEVGPGLLIIERYVVEERARKVWDEVAIVRVPAASPEELTAYFEWGGWNAVPSPAWIVAVARHWSEAYGAELVAMGPDLLEFNVPRKPPDHASAVALLKEHYVFAPDSFQFERNVLEQAAAQLRTSGSWVFWWD